MQLHRCVLSCPTHSWTPGKVLEVQNSPHHEEFLIRLTWPYLTSLTYIQIIIINSFIKVVRHKCVLNTCNYKKITNCYHQAVAPCRWARRHLWGWWSEVACAVTKSRLEVCRSRLAWLPDSRLTCAIPSFQDPLPTTLLFLSRSRYSNHIVVVILGGLEIPFCFLIRFLISYIL